MATRGNKMKVYRISYDGPFFSGCDEVEAPSKRKAIKRLKHSYAEVGVKIKIFEVSEIKEN